jgi:signal transduction histidine kinase
MELSPHVIDSPVPLESVITTAELGRRPSRPPDYEAENRALVALAREMANSPTGILQKLVDAALELCRAQSAGISLLEDDRKRFRWRAIAGQWASHLGGGTPRDFGPCGTVLDRNIALLFSHPERHFTYLAPVTPCIEEGLLIPFHVGGEAVGTIWVIAHDERRKFDAEDMRVMKSLGEFAVTAYQVLSSLDALKFARGQLEQANADLLHGNEMLKVQVAEREQSEQALRQSEEKLRQQSHELEQQLIASGRLVSLGEITASMAHEFNNPLGIIMGFTQDLLGETTPSSPNYQALKIIDEESKRCQKIIRDLLDYARPKSADFCPTDIRQLVEKTISLVANHLYKQKIESATEIEESLPSLHADPQQLEQVLVNIYLNALDAMSEGGKLTVAGTLEGESKREGDGKVGGVMISVTDTGFGIEEHDLPKIFQPFFSAKKKRGLGLGLPICERIVKNHGGRIEVESRPGQGTSFKIYLPLTRALSLEREGKREDETVEQKQIEQRTDGGRSDRTVARNPR